MSCGGQGYNDFSGLPPLWRHHSATPTVEGENTMIILQTSRFLLKNFKHAFDNKG
jgi:acyl-CoA oxidase